jgi:hypothetical protein
MLVVDRSYGKADGPLREPAQGLVVQLGKQGDRKVFTERPALPSGKYRVKAVLNPSDLSTHTPR